MEGSEPLILSADVFKYWILDPANRQIKIIYQDGREDTQEMKDDDPLLNSEIKQSIFDWEKWWVIIITSRDHLIITEAYSPVGSPPLRSRPSIYLDQNHWSAVANALIEPKTIKPPERREAAQRLAELAKDAGAVLPLSSAHLAETTPLFGDRRYNLGATMANLSGGWQMRHPVEVWKSEVREVLADVIEGFPSLTQGGPVITLEPQAMLHGTSRVRNMNINDVELFTLTLTDPNVIVELLIHPEKLERISVAGWAERNQNLTDHVANLADDISQKRTKAVYAFWYECLYMLRTELDELGISAELIMSIDIKVIKRKLDEKPMLRHLAYLFIQRYVDKSIRWKENDLNDMVFLACAAGYADYVVAENHTGRQLQQFQASTGRKSNVFRTLEDLVVALQRDGVTTDTEKLGAEASESL